VPFFFKQWGGARKKKAGRLLEGRTWDEVPYYQVGYAPSAGIVNAIKATPSMINHV
jgi:hypothetical protein